MSNLYHPTWITIAASSFMMGSDPRDAAPPFANERPQHRVEMPTFHISRVPITNAQYHHFVSATHYPPPAHWHESAPRSGTEQFPVTYVTWDDAQAYCAWAGVRLPSEAEWEKAARGPALSAQPTAGEARTWPWGNDLPTAIHAHFNGQAQGIAPASQSVMPVGQFTRGASPYGLLDMAGNVWEWTSSRYRPYPYNADDGREEISPLASKDKANERTANLHTLNLRVVRGGSYNHDLRQIRCASRDAMVAGARDLYIGFRVATSNPASAPDTTLEWITIPAGPFWMGSDPTARHSTALPSEMPAHSVMLAEYRLSQTPVTNAEYQLFTHATKYPAPPHWLRDQIPPGLHDHPVTHVDWHDAQAFCAWAGVRLPSEAEWERAAAGPASPYGQRIYPWGNAQPNASRLNFRRSGKRTTTTPVGAYPQGATPDGVYDMAGNVWEWMNTFYAPYPYTVSDGRENNSRENNSREENSREETKGEAAPAQGQRVLRGGSFISPSAAYVRSAMRSLSFPARRREHIGFRTAQS